MDRFGGAQGMTIATVDIGTNTVLLLIARVDPDGTITPLTSVHRMPRLGKGVDAERNLQPESVARVIDVLREYQGMIAPHAPDRVVVAGTSAVRDAHNREEFARRVRGETGFELEVLSGKEEALWSYRGAISGLHDIRAATVVDIGGGSTEITPGDRKNVSHTLSLEIGSVRLTERFFRHDPPDSQELPAAEGLVKEELDNAPHIPVTGSTLVGVAGTATSLAVLDQGLKEFRVEAVTGYRLRAENVSSLFRRLSTMPSARIRELSSVMEGRADIITAGALILREIMTRYGFEEMIVSERGIRYGLAIREWEKERGAM